MKCKVTEREVRNSFCKVVSVGYCRLQTLLNTESAFGYTCNRNGWKADFYDFGEVCISTGYSPIGKTISYEITGKYERKAMKNREAYHSGKIKKWETLVKRNHKLVTEMLIEAGY